MKIQEKSSHQSSSTCQVLLNLFNHRTQDIKTKKQHIPVVDRTPVEPPPVIVGIVGPPKVGKTTLLKCVVKNFSKQKLSKIQGPVTVVSGRLLRAT